MTAPKTCVLTGAASGIGLALAASLARAGHRLVLVSRNPRGLADAVSAARAVAPVGSPADHITSIRADLSTLAGTRALGDAILAAVPRLHVLIHNAGVLPTTRVLTADGFEESFAVNHLAPFVLNRLLTARLRESAPARVVQVGAGLYVAGSVDVEKSPLGLPFSPFATYGTSKLWNLLASLELAQELSGSGVTVNVVHPGVVRTGLGAMPGWKGFLLDQVKRFWLTPEKGARAPFHLATAPELDGVTGRYWNQMQPADLHPKAAKPGLGRVVVERTLALVEGR